MHSLAIWTSCAADSVLYLLHRGWLTWPREQGHPLGDPAYLVPHQPAGCGYFDVCPSNLSRPHFMDYTTATKAIDTMGMMVAKQKPFFMGVGIIRPHLPFVVPTDMWDKYDESTIKQPGSAYPPVNCASRAAASL